MESQTGRMDIMLVCSCCPGSSDCHRNEIFCGIIDGNILYGHLFLFKREKEVIYFPIGNKICHVYSGVFCPE